MSGPNVFISYSHDSSKHSESVLALSERLRDDGITTQLDQYVNGTPSNGWPRWMLDQLDEADSVIVICTETYYRRFRGHEEPGTGKGADWEGAIITQEIYDQRSNTKKFVPVLFKPDNETFIPEPLRPLTYYLLNTEQNYNDLYDFLLGQAGVEPRAVGTLKRKERRRGVPLIFSQPSTVLETAPRISPARLSVTGKKFVGREPEIALLDRAWNSAGNQKINIVSLIGQGGEGKSAIALEWYLRRARDGWQGARRVFDWSFYSQGTSAQSSASADDFFNAAFEWFGYNNELPQDPWAKGGKLAEVVAGDRTLLVLDGLEPLQQPPGDYGGEFKDPAMKAFLRGLALRNPGLCILTSRTDVTDLADFERSGGSCLRHSLFALDRNTARLLLRELGVQGPDSELDEAIGWFHGHAYDLNLLGNYLALCTDDHDIRGWQERFPILREDELIHPVADVTGKRVGHGRRMLRAYVRWLGDDSAAVAVMRLLGLFDRPARSDLFDELRAQPVISKLTEPLLNLTDDEWLRTLNQLRKLGLISRESILVPQEMAKAESRQPVPAADNSDDIVEQLVQTDDLPEEIRKLPKTKIKELLAMALESENKDSEVKRPRRPVSFVVDAHPLLREHFAAELEERQVDAWRAAHKRLYQYLSDTTADKRNPTLEDLQPLYQAVAHGCKAGLQQEVLYAVYHQRILRGREEYSWRKLGAFGSDLGAIASFFERPWTRLPSTLSDVEKAWLLAYAGFGLRALGRLTEALEPTRVALRMRVEAENWHNAAITSSTLSELELTLGEVAEAVRHAELSVVYAERSGESYHRWSKRTTLANALHQQGSRNSALERFIEGERILAEAQPEYSHLYGLAGVEYCDLLLLNPERASWLKMQKSERRYQTSASLQACRDVLQLTTQTLEWAVMMRSLLDVALNQLTLGRATLYQAVLESDGRSSPTFDPNHRREALAMLDVAVCGIREANAQQYVPFGLLSRAWARLLVGVAIGTESSQSDLDEAWEIAQRGLMRLFMADVHLYRARLFGPVSGKMVSDTERIEYPWNKNPDGSVRGPLDDIREARKLIEQCGYWRRKEELEDAEEASKNW